MNLSFKIISPCQRLFLIHSPLCQYVCIHSELHSSLTSHVTKITPVLLFIWQWLSLIFLWITSKLMKICNHQFDIKIQLSLFNSNTVIIEMREIICNVFVQKAWDYCYSLSREGPIWNNIECCLIGLRMQKMTRMKDDKPQQ